MKIITYPIAPAGLATSFTESERTSMYARQFRNRYINESGGAEKRQGIKQLGANVPGNPSITGLHELVQPNGTATLFASGAGVVYKYDATAETYSQVHSVASSNRLFSVQMGERLIFYNGADDNFFTKDGTVFQKLNGIIEVGLIASANNNAITDSEVSDWINNTNVTLNDVVFFNNSNAYGLVTAVSASALHFTAVSADARGAGAGAAPAANDPYEVLDLIELNIINNGAFDDNVATTTTGTSAGVIVVSGVNFSATTIQVGDFVSNTTRAAVTRVTSVSSNINVSAIATQTSGDSIVLLKPAMPRASVAHVHFGHLYMVDSRNETLVTVTGPGDPTDVTSSGAGVLDFGDVQPGAEVVKAMSSYQDFMCFAGQENVVFYKGTIPFGAGASFAPEGIFPQGITSRYGMRTIGNDVLFIGHDGLQSIRQANDSSTLNRDGLSFSINETLRDEIDAVSEDEIQLFHYRQRSWLLLKVGDLLYCYNYATKLQDRKNVATTEDIYRGTITSFDGPFARQNIYMERSNDNLIAGGAGGKVYIFDQDVYTDDGASYSTVYQTGYLTGEKSNKSVNRKALKYIKPLFNVGAAISYTIKAEGGFGDESSDESVTLAVSASESTIGIAKIPFVIGGSTIDSEKFPLRARGEVFRITFETNDGNGPDVLNRFALYMSEHGAR